MCKASNHSAIVETQFSESETGAADRLRLVVVAEVSFAAAGYANRAAPRFELNELEFPF